ncbi:hypothetical protein M1555_02905 [Patescibacteria group bacterium]|nr:hypothetical protein [Patescibacteria group bacterium]
MTEGSTIQFEGQQEGERVLYVIRPHAFAKRLAVGKLILLTVFFFIILWLISDVFTGFAGVVRTVDVVLSLILLAVGFWWNTTVYGTSKTFITDRRIIRFEVMTPFVTTKRALFWNEALKAKGYASGLLYRMMKIGTLEVEPHLSDHENVLVHDVYYYEDLANYIDKILYIFKNQPAETAAIRPFVPKPRGQRDSVQPDRTGISQ